MHYLGNEERLETRSVAELAEIYRLESVAWPQVNLGVAVAHAICGPGNSWADDREQAIEKALAAAEKAGRR